MSLAGTIVNGAIRLDGNPPLPEGVRVRIEFENDDELPGMETTETHEEHLAALRESIEEAAAGKTRPAREVMRELALKHGLTPYGE